MANQSSPTKRRPLSQPGNTMPDTKTHAEDATLGRSSFQLQAEAVSVELARYTSVPVQVLLNKVIEYLEMQVNFAEDILSPQEKPRGIDAQHSLQITACLVRFRAAAVTSVTIRDYVERLHQHCEFSCAKLLAVVSYLTTMESLYSQISKVLRKNTVHRLVLASFVIACKVLDDKISRQIRYSVVGGLSLAHLHGLELALFFLLNGQVWLTEARLVGAGRLLYGEPVASPVEPLLVTTDDVIWSRVGNRVVG